MRLAKEKKSGDYVALKMLKKIEILRLKQVDHIISENTILSNINHPFLVSLLAAKRPPPSARARTLQLSQKGAREIMSGVVEYFTFFVIYLFAI